MNTQKRLYRSTQDRMFAGVCGGIGEYLDVDPTLVRLAFVALTLLSSGSGLVIYLILMLIVPERPSDRRKPKIKREEDGSFPEDDVFTVTLFNTTVGHAARLCPGNNS